MTAEDIILIEGSRDLLLIAPHGHPKDDENTGELTRKVAGHLNCRAIVNLVYRKPLGSDRPDLAARRLNLNKTDQAVQHPWFVNAVRSTADAPGRTVVVWMHGIKDENIQAEAERTDAYEGDPRQLLVLAGYGQGASSKTGEPHHRCTAYPETVNRLIERLTANRLTAMAVRVDAASYRGRHEDYMNQWFLQNGYPLTSVESIQLELKYTGVRDSSSLDSASQSIAAALKTLQ
jgi:hypothetical protein